MTEQDLRMLATTLRPMLVDLLADAIRAALGPRIPVAEAPAAVVARTEPRAEVPRVPRGPAGGERRIGRPPSAQSLAIIARLSAGESVADIARSMGLPHRTVDLCRRRAVASGRLTPAAPEHVIDHGEIAQEAARPVEGQDGNRQRLERPVANRDDVGAIGRPPPPFQARSGVGYRPTPERRARIAADLAAARRPPAPSPEFEADDLEPTVPPPITGVLPVPSSTWSV